MTQRDEFIEYVQTVVDTTPALAGVQVIPTPRELGVPGKPLLIVGRPSYQKLAEAPLTRRRATFPCALVTNLTDQDGAEDQLDDLLEALLPALVTASLSWSAVEPTSWDESHLAYDISVTTILKPA